MKTYVAPLFITLIMTPLSAALACEAPSPPAIPDEGTSTLEEMVAAQVEVKSFQAANEGYLQCLDSRLSAAQAFIDAGDTNAIEQYVLIAVDYNAAVSREEQLAASFNS